MYVTLSALALLASVDKYSRDSLGGFMLQVELWGLGLGVRLWGSGVRGLGFRVGGLRVLNFGFWV